MCQFFTLCYFTQIIENADVFGPPGIENAAQKICHFWSSKNRMYINIFAFWKTQMYIIRYAIDATLTEERHVIMAWKIVQEYADTLLGKY